MNYLCKSARCLEATVLLLLFCGMAAAKEPITVYLAGDSTMAEKMADKRPETGWGEALQQFFDHDSHGEYPDIVRAVAAENKVPLIDMHRKSERVIKQHGVEQSKKLFLQLKPDENATYPNGIEDNTHFSPLGAEIMARLAVEGIRELKLSLAKRLKESNTAKLRK